MVKVREVEERGDGVASHGFSGSVTSVTVHEYERVEGRGEAAGAQHVYRPWGNMSGSHPGPQGSTAVSTGLPWEQVLGSAVPKIVGAQQSSSSLVHQESSHDSHDDGYSASTVRERGEER
jgi:hypothetical protein